MKRITLILTLLLAAVLIFSSCGQTDAGSLAFVSNSLGTCYVSGIGTCTDTAVVVPTFSPEGDRVIGIGEGAFSYCTSITSVTIPESVGSIGAEAFSGCSSLVSITLSDGLTSIGDGAFSDYSSLEGVYITDLTGWFGISFGNYYASPLVYAKKLYLNGELVTDLVIPAGVVSIKNRALSYCSSLTSVTIPESVTSIGFAAFAACTGLTSVTIPKNVTRLDNYAFSACSSLTSVTIPESVTSIGDTAFYECTSLTSITYQGTQAQWNAVNKGSDWDFLTGSYTIHCTDGDIAK